MTRKNEHINKMNQKLQVCQRSIEIFLTHQNILKQNIKIGVMVKIE